MGMNKNTVALFAFIITINTINLIGSLYNMPGFDFYILPLVLYVINFIIPFFNYIIIFLSILLILFLFYSICSVVYHANDFIVQRTTFTGDSEYAIEIMKKSMLSLANQFLLSFIYLIVLIANLFVLIIVGGKE